MDTDELPRGVRELFDQGRVWKDKTGTWHDLATMDQRHRANLLPFLRKRAAAYQDACHEEAVKVFFDAPDDVYEEVMEPFFLDPVEWLEGTTLGRTLRRFEEQATSLDRLRTRSHNRTYRLRRWLGIARS